MLAKYAQLIATEHSIPRDKSDISLQKYSHAEPRRINAKGVIANINGLTLATGNVLVKFQSCAPTLLYTMITSAIYGKKTSAQKAKFAALRFFMKRIRQIATA